MSITAMFSEVDQCPFCKEYDLIHVICDPIIRCTRCGKHFTKQEAEAITGVVCISRNVYDNIRRKL